MSSPDLDANYAAAFAGHLRAGTSPALLIVDVVMAYLLPDSLFFAPSAAAALACNMRLAQAARAADMPVILTQVSYQSDLRDGGLFARKVPALMAFVAGSASGAFPEGLHQPGDLLIAKSYASAFFGTSLASTLRVMGVDTLLITGYSTSGCVRASAFDALQNGFVPLVVRDACADRHAAPHEANLFDLQAKYAEVIDEPAALGVLRQRRVEQATPLRMR